MPGSEAMRFPIDRVVHAGMARRTFLAGLASLPLAGCAGIVPIVFRYRMTVEVDTPEGLRSGSSVIEVTMRRGGFAPDDQPVNVRFRGEAVGVVLPGRGRLWALLRTFPGSDAAEYPFYAYDPALPPQAANGDGWAERAQALARQRDPAVLPRHAYPWLVRFRNERDSRTMESVFPQDLPSSFGRGVSLRDILIQIVDTPPTIGATNALPWLEGSGPLVPPSENLLRPNPLSKLNRDDFKRGL